MNRPLVYALILAAFLIPSFLAIPHRDEPDQLGHADHVPAVAPGFEAVDNTPTFPPGVKPKSRGRKLRTAARVNRSTCRRCRRVVPPRNLFDPTIPLCWRCHLGR